MTDTSNRDLSWYLERAQAVSAERFGASNAADLGRQSIEAIEIARSGNARAVHSEGHLRLHGQGVNAHLAPLDVVGKIAIAWQKAISAVGASLEGIKSPLGKLPTDITRRTRLALNASPVPGSVILNITPTLEPLTEAEPNGDRSMLNVPRPLADRSNERLISLLINAANSELRDLEALTEEIRNLGPRVASAVAQFSKEVDKGNLDIDASWREPENPTIEATLTVSAAKFIFQFIEGQELDGIEDELEGTLTTISSTEPWFIELADEAVHMDASSLSSEVPTRLRVGQRVRLHVYVTIRETPDGSTRKRFKILRVSEADGEID